MSDDGGFLPLSKAPAPEIGQVWDLAKLEKRAKRSWTQVVDGEKCYDLEAGTSWFRTLVGYSDPNAKGADVAPFLANLGLYFWYIPPLYDDAQTAHKEDEAYYVISGKGQICIEGVTRKVKAGDLIFVPRSAQHHFRTPDPKGEGLTILIIFSPPYTAGAPQATDKCCDPKYQQRSWRFVDRLRRAFEKAHPGNSCPPWKIERTPCDDSKKPGATGGGKRGSRPRQRGGSKTKG